MDADNFPELPEVTNSPVTMQAGQMRTLIKSTAFAITKEESRYTLSGARLEMNAGRVRMVATDGHRLSLAEFEGSFGGTLANLIPQKTLIELSRLIAAEEEDAQLGISWDANHFRFAIGKRVLLSRMLTGQFPNYELILPKNELTLQVERRELEAALHRVMLMADDKSHALQFSLESGSLEVLAPASERGDAGERLVVSYDGPKTQLALNGEYVLDAIQPIVGKVLLKLKDAQTQTEFTNETGTGYRCIIMPMRL